ncbi:hypothetical protein D1AOALGA4SA_10336 [Olavius algarvensis Delta 1 endosymbiont]|nr:hypothetical protein D1AOALGA4SA_10336 [Olavius algarvensis Delta 1 endosymbiont]
MPSSRGQMTENRGQKTEVRRQRLSIADCGLRIADFEGRPPCHLRLRIAASGLSELQARSTSRKPEGP